MVGQRLEGIKAAEEKAHDILIGDAGKDMTADERRKVVEILLHEFCKANGGY